MINELPCVTFPQSKCQVLGIMFTLASLDKSIQKKYSLACFHNIIDKAYAENEFIIYYNGNQQPIGFSCVGIERETITSRLFFKSKESYIHDALDPAIYDFYSIIGKAAYLLSHSPLHKPLLLEYISREVYPACWFKQIRLYHTKSNIPWGFFSWAKVSRVLYKKIDNDFTGLYLQDWQSGEYIFINDLVSLETNGSKIIARDIRENIFFEHLNIKAIRRYADGRCRIAIYYINKPEINLPLRIVTKVKFFMSHGGNINDLSEIYNDIDTFFSKFELSILLNNENDNKENIFKFWDDINRIKRSLSQKLVQQGGLSRINEAIILEKIHASRFYIDNSVYEEVNALYTSNYKTYSIQREVDDANIDAYNCLSLYEGTLSMYVPSFVEHYHSVRMKTTIDINDNKSKNPHPFTISQGVRGNSYISCSYNNDSRSVINLVHELSHALHQYITTIKSPYLFLEKRLLPSEFFAFTIEHLFLMYLKEVKHPDYESISTQLHLQDQIYMYQKEYKHEVISNEYKKIYFTARVLAKEFIDAYSNKPEIISYIEELCNKGVLFNSDIFFKNLCTRTI